MSVYVPVELGKQIRSQFDDRCAYCQTAEHLTPVMFEIEHIMPSSHGGATVLENLCLACPTCNRLKSDRPQYVRVRRMWVAMNEHPPD